MRDAFSWMTSEVPTLVVPSAREHPLHADLEPECRLAPLTAHELRARITALVHPSSPTRRDVLAIQARRGRRWSIVERVRLLSDAARRDGPGGGARRRHAAG